ncbi:MAG: hypothetical protein N2652_08785 [Kiritimatiellae bacterium]|nr:hypothetical protein [Kiritimatiellia bacterium]
MRRHLITLTATTVLAAASVLPAQERAELRIGGGATYWVALDEIEVEQIDENGFSYLVSLQLRNPMAGIGVDAELMPERFGEDAYCGQAYVVLGRGLYAGAGVGLTMVDGEVQEDPFFSLRAGVDIEVLRGLHLDVAVQYRFHDTADLKDENLEIDSDTVYLGAALRLAL